MTKIVRVIKIASCVLELVKTNFTVPNAFWRVVKNGRQALICEHIMHYHNR